MTSRRSTLERLVVGTRGSRLALWQTEHACARLRDRGLSILVEEIATTGDNILDVALSKIGDKGLFTRELDAALLDKRIDFAVHSLKDLPTRLAEGLTIAAVMERDEPWDVLVGGGSFAGRLDELPAAATIATSSLRRGAQLLAWRKDLEIVPVRGNVETRLRKLSENRWEGMILAGVGLMRLGLAEHIRERIPYSIMLPAVGQGAIAVVTRERDQDLVALLREHLDHGTTRREVMAERAFLRSLEGGCQVPIGAYAAVEEGGQSIALEGCVASLDGSSLLRQRVQSSATNSEEPGIELAELLLGQGADRILRQVRAASVPGESVRESTPPRPHVVLFRSPRENDPYVRALRASSWEADCVPVLTYSFIITEELLDRLATPDRYGGLLLTSPRALHAIASQPEALELVRERWQGRPAFAVGPATAAEAVSLGLSPRGESSGSGSDLGRFICVNPPPRPLLYLSGRPRRPDLADVLAEGDVDMEEVTVYTSEPIDISMPESIPAWVVFFSPRGVQHVANRVPLPWSEIAKAAIGPVTADAMRELGWTVDAESPDPTPESLVGAMESARRTASQYDRHRVP